MKVKKKENRMSKIVFRMKADCCHENFLLCLIYLKGSSYWPNNEPNSCLFIVHSLAMIYEKIPHQSPHIGDIQSWTLGGNCGNKIECLQEISHKVPIFLVNKQKR